MVVIMGFTGVLTAFGHGDVKDEHMNTEVTPEAKQMFYERKSAMERVIKEERELFRQQIETQKATLQQTIELRREALTKKLLTIRDERKRVLTETIYENVQKFNENRVEHYTAALEKIQTILGRIISRMEKARTFGLDISAVEGKVTEANKAIGDARAAVEVQAKKVYTITITSEATLKADVQKTREAIHADTVAVRETVRQALEAVQSVARALAGIRGINEIDIPGNTTSTK